MNDKHGHVVISAVCGEHHFNLISLMTKVASTLLCLGECLVREGKPRIAIW